MGTSNAQPDFITVLQERFDNLVISLIRRITDGHYFPLGDYLQAARADGGVETARTLVHSSIAEPLLTALLDSHRPDLTIQFYMLRVPWFLLFFTERDLIKRATEQWRAACSNERSVLEKFDSLLIEASSTEMLDDSSLGRFCNELCITDVDLHNTLAQLIRDRFYSDGRYTHVDLRYLEERRAAEARTRSPEELIASLAQDLDDEIPLTVHKAHRLALQDSPHLAQRFPEVAEAIRHFDEEHQSALIAAAREIEKALDFSRERILRALKFWELLDQKDTLRKYQSLFMKPQGARHSLAACAYESQDQPTPPCGDTGLRANAALIILQQSALSIATAAGRYLLAYGKTFGLRRDIMPTIYRRKHGFNTLHEFSQQLTKEQCVYLQFAEECRRIETLNVDWEYVCSDNTLEEVPAIYEMCQIAEYPWPDYFDEHPDPSDLIITALRAAYLVTHPDLNIEDIACVNAGDLERLEDSVLLSDYYTRKLRDSLKSASELRKSEIEAAIRRRMGNRLFEWLCPEAVQAVLGAECVLQTPDFPDPTQAVMGLAQAFECQLKYRVLEQFCTFLRHQDILSWPVSSGEGRGPLLLRYGEMDINLSLEKILRFIERADKELETFFGQVGLDRARVAAAVREVRRLRNWAAHQGGLGREFALRTRDAWLRPDAGVFAVLCPGTG
jgi:hypothetical protein